MRVSWPSPWRRTARFRTWSLTPPGDAKSYGETSPILISSRPRPDSMRNVPLLRVPLDEPLDVVQQLLGRAHLVGPHVAGRPGDHQRRAFDLKRIVRQAVDAHRKQRRAEAQGDRGW